MRCWKKGSSVRKAVPAGALYWSVAGLNLRSCSKGDVAARSLEELGQDARGPGNLQRQVMRRFLIAI
jgi:hypothetical protein